MVYEIYYAVFFIGLFLGMAFVLFVQGASKTEKENELFMEGYNAGLKENKKMAPMKPIEDVYGNKCKVCGRYVWGIVSKMEYCANCDQRIDWSDEEQIKMQ